MVTTWQVPAVLTILIAYGVQPYLNKTISAVPGRARNLVLQYFFAFIIIASTVIGLHYFGLIRFGIDKKMAAVTGLCLINAFACYAYWRAIAINMTITSVSTWADDLIGMLLGYFILSEGRYLTPRIAMGILLAFVSVLIFSFVKSSLRGIGSQNLWRIYGCIGTYSLIWGGLNFLMRYFSLRGMVWWQFLLSWYSGSFLGAMIVFWFSGPEERGDRSTLKMAIKTTMTLAFCIVISLGLLYWTRSLAPMIVATPVLQVSEMIFPTLIGLWIFHERKNFNLLGWVAMVIGFIGSLSIVFSY